MGSVYANKGGAGGSVYAKKGGGGGSVYAKKGAPAPPQKTAGGLYPASKKKSGGGGVFGALTRFPGDTRKGLEKAAVGIGPALWHTGGAIKGDVAQIITHPTRPILTQAPRTTKIAKLQVRAAKETVQHPLRDPVQTALLGLTAFSGGASLVGRTGALAAKAGVVSREARVANMLKPGEIHLRSPKQAAAEGAIKKRVVPGSKIKTAPVLVKESKRGPTPELAFKPTSAKPAQRLVQTSFDRAMKKTLPYNTPILGEGPRYGKAIKRDVLHPSEVLQTNRLQHQKAIQNLNKYERIAYSLKAREITPGEQLAFWKRSAPKTGDASYLAEKQNRLVSHQKVAEAFSSPSPRLQHALEEGRKLGDIHSAHQILHSPNPELSAAAFEARPFQHALQVRGQFVDTTKMENRLTRLESLHTQALKNNWHGARLNKIENALASTMQEIDHAQTQHASAIEALKTEGKKPFYIPDVSLTKQEVLHHSGAGIGVPKKLPAGYKNRGILHSMGQFEMDPSVLDNGFMRYVKFQRANDIHEELLSQSVKIKHGEVKPKGYIYLREKPSERISHTEKTRGDLIDHLEKMYPEHQTWGEGHVSGMEHFATHEESLAGGSAQYRHIVPERLAKNLAGEFARSSRTVHLFVENPMNVWRSVVLGLRVGFFTNNIVGNHLMLAARHMGKADFWRAYMGLFREMKGNKAVQSLEYQLKTKYPREYRDVLLKSTPEQYQGTMVRSNIERRPGASRLRRAAQGVGPVTVHLAEDVPREIVHRVATMKEIRALGHKIPKQTADFNALAREVLKDPKAQRRVTNEINATLGDYLSLSAIERGVVRKIIPFYSWLRVIASVSGRLAFDSPGRALLLANMGKVGSDMNEKEWGMLPDYARGMIGLGPQKGAYKPGLSTGGLNPYNTIAQELRVATGNDSAKALGEIGLSPLLSGFMEYAMGHKLFSQYAPAPHGPLWKLPPAVLQAIAEGTPPARLIAAATGHEYRGKPGKPTSSKKGFKAALLSYLGTPAAQRNMAKLHSAAYLQDHPTPRH